MKIFSTEKIKIVNDDCLNNNLLEFADLIITDPPYKLTSGGNNCNWNIAGIKGVYDNSGNIVKSDITWKQIMGICYNALKSNCHAYIMTNNRNMQEALFEADKAGFKLHNILVWDKGTVTPNRWYMNKVEFCLFLYKGKSKYINNMGVSNIFRIKNNQKNGHPTGKPVALFEEWILQSSSVGEIIYDPFCGCGSSAVASILNNRKYIGYEIDEVYFNKAKEYIVNIINGDSLSERI
jgi:site-specific DNA-methyltransferase (adenine-specific)